MFTHMHTDSSMRDEGEGDERVRSPSFYERIVLPARFNTITILM